MPGELAVPLKTKDSAKVQSSGKTAAAPHVDLRCVQIHASKLTRRITLKYYAVPDRPTSWLRFAKCIPDRSTDLAIAYKNKDVASEAHQEQYVKAAQPMKSDPSLIKRWWHMPSCTLSTGAVAVAQEPETEKAKAPFSECKWAPHPKPLIAECRTQLGTSPKNTHRKMPNTNGHLTQKHSSQNAECKWAPHPKALIAECRMQMGTSPKNTHRKMPNANGHLTQKHSSQNAECKWAPHPKALIAECRMQMGT